MWGFNGDMEPLRSIVEVARDGDVLDHSFRMFLG